MEPESWRSKDRWIRRACWPASLAKLVSSGFDESACFKKQGSLATSQVVLCHVLLLSFLLSRFRQLLKKWTCIVMFTTVCTGTNKCPLLNMFFLVFIEYRLDIWTRNEYRNDRSYIEVEIFHLRHLTLGCWYQTFRLTGMLRFYLRTCEPLEELYLQISSVV